MHSAVPEWGSDLGAVLGRGSDHGGVPGKGRQGLQGAGTLEHLLPSGIWVDPWP